MNFNQSGGQNPFWGATEFDWEPKRMGDGDRMICFKNCFFFSFLGDLLNIFANEVTKTRTQLVLGGWGICCLV